MFFKDKTNTSSSRLTKSKGRSCTHNP